MCTLLVDYVQLDMRSQCSWEHDLQEQIDETDWTRSNKYIMDVSFNIVIQEAYYKIRNSWYLTEDYFLQ